MNEESAGHMAWLPPRWVLYALLGLAAFLAWTRWRTYDEPVDTDVANFSVIGHGLLQGRALYSDLFDLKPPLIYATFAGAELLAGQGYGQLYLLGCLFGFLTLAGVYFAGLQVGNDPRSGLVAAVVYAVCNNNVQIWSSQLFAEYFESACLVWAFVLIVRLLDDPNRTRLALGAGLSLAASTFFKHPSIVYWLVLGPFLLLLTKRPHRWAAGRQVLVVTAVVASLWGAVTLYFRVTGRFQDLRDALIIMNGYNAGGSLLTNLEHALSLRWLSFYAQHRILLIQGGFILAGAIAGCWRGPRRKWVLFAGSLLAIHVVITLPFRAFHYYLQLWLPFLAVGCGWSWRALADFRARFRPLPEVSFAVVMLLLLWVQVPWFFKPAQAWSEYRRGGMLIATQQVGRELPRLLDGNESFYMWGGETGLYFESRRLPPTGFINIDSVEAGPIASRLAQRMINQLQANPPEMLIIWIDNARMPVNVECAKIWRWFLQNYGMLPTGAIRGPYLLCCRINGSVEKRVGSVRPLIEQLRVRTPGGSEPIK